jgi:ribonucleoside-diphosphate reductase alpha chain
MVQGHDYVKIATSVIDYIFRDLAISYLKRTDLGQVKPEDLNTMGTKDEFGDAQADMKHHRPHLKVEHKPGGSGTPVRGAAITAGGTGGPVLTDAAKIAQARIKGYEGDPCPACGSFTLVRNGTCMKCDTCGGTTGCS